MLVKTLDNIESEWKVHSRDKCKKCSKEHKRARKLLSSVFPGTRITEEIRIEIESGKFLYLDFYIPALNMAIEVHGGQHYSYNSFHFKNRMDWLRAVANDKKKIEWCKLNSINIVELPHNETDEQWKTRLN